MKNFYLIFFILISSSSARADELETYLYQSNQNLKTQSFALIKNGKAIFKKGNIDPVKKFKMWSMSKSITSLLIGIAQDKGLLSINDKVSKYLKIDSDKKNMTIKHVLEMSSGIEWREIYDSSPFRSHVVNMLYNSEIKSMGAYALSLPMASAPGTSFNYSSGDTNLLNLILKVILKEKNYKTYPWDWLFDPLEMKNVSFEMDQSESFVGSSYLYLSVKDLLKIGQLILDKGFFKGKKIISEDYINYATSLSKTMREKYCLRDHKRTYGAQFWLNAACPNGKKPFENVSEDIVMMLGYSGQNLILFPSKNSMALRFADDKHGALKLKEYLPIVERRLDEN